MAQKQQVLVVDDSPTFQSYISALLEDAGYEPVVAGTLEETKQILSSSPSFVCSVLDYCLPDAPKGEVIDFVLTSGYRAIVLTGNAETSIREDMLSKGIVDYILKDSAVSLAFLVPLLNRLVHNQCKIALVVDDSSAIRQYLTELLERQYLTVLSASDGFEALEVFDNVEGINLVITDNDMPNMDGIELTQHLRINHSRDELAIMGLSASTNSDITPQFLKAGANDYLNKPFNQEELYCRIHSLLDMQDASEQLFYLANRDELTELWNRRYFFNFAYENPSPSKILVMIDVDHFKKINDKYGHEAGDFVLKKLGQLLKKSFNSALPARLGGEEFVVLCTGSENKFEQELKELEKTINSYVIDYQDQEIRFTVSMGVAKGDRPLTELLKEADNKLYQAKNMGRNQIVF